MTGFHVAGRKMGLSKLFLVAFLALSVCFITVTAQGGTEDGAGDGDGDRSNGLPAEDGDPGQDQVQASQIVDEVAPSQIPSSRPPTASVGKKGMSQRKKITIAAVVILVLLVLSIGGAVLTKFVVKPKYAQWKYNKLVAHTGETLVEGVKITEVTTGEGSDAQTVAVLAGPATIDSKEFEHNVRAIKKLTSVEGVKTLDDESIVIPLWDASLQDAIITAGGIKIADGTPKADGILRWCEERLGGRMRQEITHDKSLRVYQEPNKKS